MYKSKRIKIAHTNRHANEIRKETGFFVKILMRKIMYNSFFATITAISRKPEANCELLSVGP